MNKTPEDVLNEHLTHSTRLSDITINYHTSALECDFPTMERYEYIMRGEGNMVVLSARPGHGKTALACQISLNVSKHGRVLLFSLEMKKEVLKKRLMAVVSGVPIKRLGLPSYKQRVEAAEAELNRHRLDIIDDSGLSINDVILKVKDEYNREPIDLVVIDYIGLIKVDNTQRALSISQTAKRIKKEIAEPLKIPVLVLAQMRRGFEERYAKAKLEYEKGKQFRDGGNPKIMDIRPSLEDLGESSGIEHNADAVLFLFRPYLVNPEESPSLFKVFVGKNRNGEVKDFELEFSQELTKFVDRGNVL